MTTAPTAPSRTKSRRLGAPSGRALLACAAYRWLGAAVLVAPLAQASGQLVGHHPRGDAVLWAPGAVWLSEWARLLPPRLAASTPLLGVAAVGVALGWLLPLGALVHSMARPRRGGWWAGVRVAFEQLPRLALLQGAVGMAATAVLVMVVALGTLASTTDSLTAATTATLWVLLALGAGTTWLALFMWQDALRLSAIDGRYDRAWRWLCEGGGLLLRAGLSGAWACAWRALAATAALLLCGAGAWRLSLHGRSAWVLLPLHIIGTLTWLLLRADWLRWLGQFLPQRACAIGEVGTMVRARRPGSSVGRAVD